MDTKTIDRYQERREATALFARKIAYYVELERNGKTKKQAKKLADEFAANIRNR